MLAVLDLAKSSVAVVIAIVHVTGEVWVEEIDLLCLFISDKW